MKDSFCNRMAAQATFSRMRASLLRWGPAALVGLAVGGLNVLLSAVSMFGQLAAEGTDFEGLVVTNHFLSSNVGDGVVGAVRLLNGQSLAEASGLVYRMPGYSLFCALAIILSGVDQTDIAGLYRAVIAGHAALTIFAFAVLGWALVRRLHWTAAAAILAVLSVSVQNLLLAQPDTIMFALWLIAAAAIFEYAANPKSLARFLLLHIAFAAMMFMRSDILFAWLGVALITCWKAPRRFALVAGVFAALVLGNSILNYVPQDGPTLIVSSRNTGHVAFVGLWENKNHPFVWADTDGSYNSWIAAHGHAYGSPSALGFSIKEIGRFYFTYPVFVADVGLSKLIDFFSVRGPAASVAYYSPAGKLSGLLTPLKYPAFLLAVAGVLFACDRVRSALLAAPIFLTLPIFCLFQESTGRYTYFITAAIFISAVAAVTDGTFWRRVAKRPATSAAVAGALLALAPAAHVLHEFINKNESLKLLTLLDPTQSTLSVFKEGRGAPEKTYDGSYTPAADEP